MGAGPKRGTWDVGRINYSYALVRSLPVGRSTSYYSTA